MFCLLLYLCNTHVTEPGGTALGIQGQRTIRANCFYNMKPQESSESHVHALCK